MSLGEELEFLNHYLNIMRVRFEERLNVGVKVESETRNALVPQLLLQPPVENSIRHALDPITGAVSVVISARRQNGLLMIEVCDNGPGIKGKQEAVLGSGIGLFNTAEKLHQLYGAQGGLSLEGTEVMWSRRCLDKSSDHFIKRF